MQALRTVSLAKRRTLFKEMLNRRLRKKGVNILFLRLEKNRGNTEKSELAWKIIVEYDSGTYTLRSRIYKSETPWSVRVLKDLVSDIGLWKDQMEKI